MLLGYEQPGVAKITDLVTEIAASAQEQASGLAQVNTAVNQMDHMTQQNAAMVEESTAASHALAKEAGELDRLMGEFDLGDSRGGVQRTAPRARPARPPAPCASAPGRGYSSSAATARKIAPAQAADAWEEF